MIICNTPWKYVHQQIYTMVGGNFLKLQNIGLKNGEIINYKLLLPDLLQKSYIVKRKRKKKWNQNQVYLNPKRVPVLQICEFENLLKAPVRSIFKPKGGKYISVKTRIQNIIPNTVQYKQVEIKHLKAVYDRCEYL